MSKILIVSNRLPLQINIKDNDFEVVPSVGGLATGMKSVHQSSNSKWIGWTGMAEEDIPNTSKQGINSAVEKEKCVSVNLTQKEIDLFYGGFSNKTIWPLFHYFTEYTEYKKKYWDAYIAVNKKFAEIVIANIKKGDKVWIHDYQLLLLPKMIKDKCPEVSIGFFLHIPFPSFEVFRILPWRNELLRGMLGADIIAFHTYDYERHFFSSVRRILGYEIDFNTIKLEDRTVLAESLPMGIDYNKFNNAAIVHQQKSIKDKSKLQQELDKYLLMSPGAKLVLSIDRLDYTKGIPNRLRAFEYFLENNPEFLEKVSLVMLAVPSRSEVEQYKKMKSEIDELVGKINGRFSNINWTPVWYFYRSFPFENLIDLYTSCDIALLTPIRDGMNLVAKEYIASRIDKKGVLILSEMAGATKEMSEAIAINPNSYEEISNALKQAIQMPESEQIQKNIIMQERLKRYNIEKWANDFMSAFGRTKDLQHRYLSKKFSDEIKNKFLTAYQKAKKRILFLDYDGTLVGFSATPQEAKPDKELYEILDALSEKENTEVVLISGRDKDTFTEWFGDRNYSLIVEHGVWSKNIGEKWKLIEQMNIDWKEVVRSAIQFYVDRTPGTFIEEKNYTLVWHYRKADPELGFLRANELKDELTNLVGNHNLEILEGNKIIEIKNSGINKGRAASEKIKNKKYDFILGIGDDWTDEYLFKGLPQSSYTIKVGITHTKAKYNIDTYHNVRKLLSDLTKI